MHKNNQAKTLKLKFLRRYLYGKIVPAIGNLNIWGIKYFNSLYRFFHFYLRIFFFNIHWQITKIIVRII